MDAAFDQHTVACRLADAREDRRGRGDGQGARRCGDQDRQPAQDALLPGQPAEQGGHDDHQQHSHEDQWHEDLLKAVGELLRGRFLRLSLLDHLDDACQGGVLGQLRHLDLQ